MLGKREPEIYGYYTLDQINEKIKIKSQSIGIEVECRQSNHEGDLVDWIQDSYGKFDGIIINPGAYTHTSIAIKDAISSIPIPCIEVHLSNIKAREEFRHKSLITPVVIGSISGFGFYSYLLALDAIKYYLTDRV